MQILVLNTDIENRMLEFCSQALYQHTLDIFSSYGWVIHDERFELTSPRLYGVTVHSIWRIDEFILKDDIELTNRINILMSYIECNGCVLWGKENYSGRYFVPFLRRLVVEHIITEELNNQIFDKWTDYRNGRRPKPMFDLV